MTIKKYSSNLVSVANDIPICILAVNKKDAVKLVKVIKGITIGHAFDIAESYKVTIINYEEFMNRQQSLLNEAFEKGMVKINEIKE